MYVCMYVWMYVCMDGWMDVCMYVCMYVHTRQNGVNSGVMCQFVLCSAALIPTPLRSLTDQI